MVTKAPGHLNEETRQWYEAIASRFVLEDHHLRLLLIAGECWDRRQQCRDILDRDGLTVVDKYGAMKPHPCLAVERDCRTQFMRAIRELGLDLAEEPARPPITQPAWRKSHA